MCLLTWQANYLPTTWEVQHLLYHIVNVIVYLVITFCKWVQLYLTCHGMWQWILNGKVNKYYILWLLGTQYICLSRPTYIFSSTRRPLPLHSFHQTGYSTTRWRRTIFVLDAPKLPSSLSSVYWCALHPAHQNIWQPQIMNCWINQLLQHNNANYLWI